MNTDTNKPRVVCAVSAAGYLHVGGLRQLLAAERLAQSLRGELVVRVQNYFDSWVEPEWLMRGLVAGNGAWLAVGYVRRVLEEIGLSARVVRLSEGVGEVRQLLAGRLVALADGTVTKEQFLGWLVAAGMAEADAAAAVGQYGEAGDAVAYRRTVGGESVCLQQMDGCPGAELVGLALDHRLAATHRVVQAEEESVLRELDALLVSVCPEWSPPVTIGVPGMTAKGRRLEDDEHWVGFEPEPETAALRAMRICGVEKTVQALDRSLDEGVNDWETIGERWLKPRHTWCQPRSHHQRFCPALRASLEQEVDEWGEVKGRWLR